MGILILFKHKKYIDKYGKLHILGVRIKNMHNRIEFKRWLESKAYWRRWERQMERAEHELTVEEIGITREAILESLNEDMWRRPRKKGSGGEATGERKDGRVIRKREMKLRGRQFGDDFEYY